MKKRYWGIALLVLVTAVITGFYLHNRDSVKAGDLLIKSAGGDKTVTLRELDLSPVSGVIKNKKGEEKQIDADGYPVSKIPSLAGVSEYAKLSVYSDDEYNAVLTKDELSSSEKAWLIIKDDSIRLIVFGDEDSKRDVKNVVRVEIQ